MDRPKFEVADVFRRYGDAYRHEHGASLCTAQRSAMTAIEVCRTAVLGGHLEHCDHCGHQRNAYNSCCDRHCPKCQSFARFKWLVDRQAELLNTQYFHVVFTLPQQIATIAYQNKRELYAILFRATAQTLLTIAADPKHLGAEIGFFAVLHTWGQNLLHHPHLHCLVTTSRLLHTAKHRVTFHSNDYRHDAQHKAMTLQAEEFIRRFLLHVLPEGFRRIRSSGFLANRSREQKLPRCRELLDMPAPEPPALEGAKDYRERYEELIGPSLRECPVCHQGRMLLIEILPRSPHRKMAITDTS